MLGTEVNREETKEEGRRAIKRSPEGSKGRGTSDDRCGWRVRGERRVYVYDLKHKTYDGPRWDIRMDGQIMKCYGEGSVGGESSGGKSEGWGGEMGRAGAGR